MEQSTHFWDKAADKYSKQPVANEEVYQKKLAVTQDYLEPHMQLLEFGCGTGSTAIVHAPHVKHIRAIDISSNMIEIARNKAQAAGIDNISFEQGTLDDLNVADESLDMVLGLNIIHLLEDTQGSIHKVYRMLKPGGLFVSSTVCVSDSLWRLIKPVVPIARALGFMPYLKFLSRQELEQTLTQSGFALDYNWRPDKSIAVFIVAKKK